MARKDTHSGDSTLRQKEPRLFFAPVLEEFFESLPLRSKEIIAARFGMEGMTPKTLEVIGETYRITRERVRQVLAVSLRRLSAEYARPSFEPIVRKIKSTLEERSGIMKEEEFLEKLAPAGGREHGALLIFLKCLPLVREENATKERERVYVLKDFSLTEWEKVKKTALMILAERGKAMDEDELFRLFEEKDRNLGRRKLFDFLSVAKEVRQNVFGKWGLAIWSDIKPRGTREKAHLVLQMAKKPLHFREIAEHIDKYGLKSRGKRQSHPQTVHNELIKDKRFVLVGRGVYALSEWGYRKGTVREVLENILSKTRKPLTREEALEEVLKVRQVKRSTVIINLNTFFERVGKDTYALKKRT